jgi:hypothetical protein
MIYRITRFYRIRAKSKDEAFRELNAAIRGGRQHVYFMGESITIDTRKQPPWLLALAQEFIRQFWLLVEGTKRR